MSLPQSKKLKFTYGHQFEPEKFSLHEIVKLCQECEPEREVLEAQILQKYFAEHSQASTSKSSADDNKKKLAMNCFLSLRSYQIVEDISNGKKLYQVTNLGREILRAYEAGENVNSLFASHILTNLTGMSLLKAIEGISARGDTPTLELIGYELQEMGFSISPNAIYPSTMRKWLKRADVLEKEYEINWDIVYDLLGANKDFIDELYSLTPQQKYFLLSCLALNIDSLTPWNKISKYATSRYQVRLPSKTFAEEIIKPLAKLQLIETQKTTNGRGGKAYLVKLTDKAKNELVGRLISTIAAMADQSETELNRSFEDVIKDLDNPDKHIKGKALELLAIWMIRLTSLRFIEWRKRDFETGKGEVDVLAASDRFVYSRWQIQCKNTKKVDVDVLAKEIGMTFVTGADVVMVVTTGEFTKNARQYASRMMEVSRYYMILLQRDDLEAIKQDKTNIINILDRQARRVFAKKELGMSNKEIENLELEEDAAIEADLLSGG